MGVLRVEVLIPIRVQTQLLISVKAQEDTGSSLNSRLGVVAFKPLFKAICLSSFSNNLDLGL
jgi:hypothetical protein